MGREIKASVWMVQGSELVQREGGSNWRRNFDVMAVAQTMEEAIAGVRELHPEAVFHAVHRGGTDKTVLVIDTEGGIR